MELTFKILRERVAGERRENGHFESSHNSLRGASASRGLRTLDGEIGIANCIEFLEDLDFADLERINLNDYSMVSSGLPSC